MRNFLNIIERNAIYRITEESIFNMCDHVCGSLQHRAVTRAATFLSGSVKRKNGPANWGSFQREIPLDTLLDILPYCNI